MTGVFVVITLVPALVVGALYFLLRLDPAPEQEDRGRTRETTPVSMLPYMGVCYACYAVITLIGVAARLRFGASMPVFGFVGMLTSIAVAVGLFTKFHQRRLLYGEKWQLTLGCFAIFWTLGSLWPVILMARGSGTAEGIVRVAVAGAIDFAFVYVILAVAAAVAQRYISSAPDAPPNNRWRGP